MAAVPELTSSMAYCSDNENDLFFEVDGPKQMKCCFPDLDLNSRGDGGFQLQVSHQRYKRSFRQVVSIVVAVQKLMSMPCPDSHAFQENDLMSIFPFIFEEEPIICDSWDDDDYLCDAPPQSLKCRLQDKEQKCLVLSSPYELHALHLTGESLHRQAVFCMSFVQGDEIANKIPVALGLKDKNLYLSCVMKDGAPTLQLERVDPKIYPKRKMEKRFVFNKTEIKGTLEFESAQFPQWYISTYQEEERPVFLGNSRGREDITDFSMEIVTP